MDHGTHLVSRIILYLWLVEPSPQMYAYTLVSSDAMMHAPFVSDLLSVLVLCISFCITLCLTAGVMFVNSLRKHDFKLLGHPFVDILNNILFDELRNEVAAVGPGVAPFHNLVLEFAL